MHNTLGVLYLNMQVDTPKCVAATLFFNSVAFPTDVNVAAV